MVLDVVKYVRLYYRFRGLHFLFFIVVLVSWFHTSCNLGDNCVIIKSLKVMDSFSLIHFLSIKIVTFVSHSG